MSKILIVEDEAKIARFVTLELEHEGYEVQCAYDGRSGLQRCLDWKPDLLILDLMLPELSGIEVCRRLRQQSDVPIIMLTAKDDVSDKVMGLDMGADDYMTKPFAIEELLARIRVALKKHRADTAQSTGARNAGKLGALMFSGTTATGEYGDWQDLHAPFSSFCADSLMTTEHAKTLFTAASAATLKFSGIKLLEINANANVSHRIAILRDGISEMKKATQ